jgi:ABC-2 type transport system ATP-binding protein
VMRVRLLPCSRSENHRKRPEEDMTAREPRSPAVEARDLTKTYPRGVKALDGLTFEVAEGETFGLLGPNGAGKSTTIKILTTLAKADSGVARVVGQDVTRDPQEVRRRIGVVSQRSGADPVASGVENLLLQGRLCRVPAGELRRRVSELLDRFGLADAASRKVRTYSGGMQRRLDIAMALVHRPRVLFLDEPTTGLDPRTRGQMWDTIRELVADGSTILLTTQYLDEADQLADRVAVIDRGRKVAEDSPDALKTQVGDSTLQLVLADKADAATAAGVVRRMLGEDPVLTPEAGRLNVSLPDPNRAADILIALREAGVDIASVSVAKPTLDEVFLVLTGHGADSDDNRTEAA